MPHCVNQQLHLGVCFFLFGLGGGVNITVNLYENISFKTGKITDQWAKSLQDNVVVIKYEPKPKNALFHQALKNV